MDFSKIANWWNFFSTRGILLPYTLDTEILQSKHLRWLCWWTDISDNDHCMYILLKEKCTPWEFSQRLHYNKVQQSSALNIQSIRRKRKMFKHFTVTVNVSFIQHSKHSKTSIGVSIPVAIDLYKKHFYH